MLHFLLLMEGSSSFITFNCWMLKWRYL